MKKQQIRELFKQKRRDLSPSELDRISEAICARLFSNFQLSKKTISLFLPIERQKEINTYLILEKGLSLDAIIGLPKMNPETQTLHHILFESHSQLALNSLGIPEPKSGKTIKFKDFEIVLIPLLAFDSTGNRVGYGKGYYDKFLGKCSINCIFIGLSLFDDPVQIEDIEAHDIRLNYCVTPNLLYRFY